jgi:hypothetical protein
LDGPTGFLDDLDQSQELRRSEQPDPLGVWLAAVWAACGFFAGVAVTTFML